LFTIDKDITHHCHTIPILPLRLLIHHIPLNLPIIQIQKLTNPILEHLNILLTPHTTKQRKEQTYIESLFELLWRSDIESVK